MRDTSLEALNSMQKRIIPLREQIFYLIRKKNGLTCEQIEIMLSISHQTASARINELIKSKQIADIGMRRMNKSGRDAIVWTSGEYL